MRNPPAAFKHADPTHLEFGKSADSSLLAKRRQNFADGGSVATSWAPNQINRGHLGSREGPSVWTGKHDKDGNKIYEKTAETYDTVTGNVAGVPNMASRTDPTEKHVEYYDTTTGNLIPKSGG